MLKQVYSWSYFTPVQWGISLVVTNVSANMAIMGLNRKVIITLPLIQHDSGKEHNAMRYNRNGTHREIGFS